MCILSRQDESDTFAAFGEEILAGFFDDVSTKKPVYKVPQVTAPEGTAAPLKEGVIANEVVSNSLNNFTTGATIIDIVSESGEKIADIPDQQMVLTTPENSSETSNQVDGEIFETAASQTVLSPEVPVLTEITETIKPTVSASSTVKPTSEEEEGLLEGIVNTLIDEDVEG